MKWKSLVVFGVALSAMALAKVDKATSGSAREVDQALASYRQAKGVQAKVKKTVLQETMGTENKSEGKFYFSKGKMRLDITEPERTTLVYDGHFVWFESRLDDEHISVSKMRVNQIRKSDSILAALFDQKDILTNFKLVSKKTVDGVKVFNFDAKNKKKSEIQSLEIALKGKEIDHIAYKDQIENKVALQFIDPSKGKVDADKFAYKPPKGAEVQDF